MKRDKDRDLQRAGAIGFSTYLSKEANNAPIRVSLQDITARAVPDGPIFSGRLDFPKIGLFARQFSGIGR